MTEIRTIKGIDEETWGEFKRIVKKHKTTTGKLFKNMLFNYERKEKEQFWNHILKGKKIISEEDAKAIDRESKEMRKEYGFRYS